MTASVDPNDLAIARELVEELLRTSLSLGDAYSALFEDLPEDAFPGEDKAAVLLEMLVGTSLTAVQAVRKEEVRVAIALIGAVRDRVIADLRAAARLARPAE